MSNATRIFLVLLRLAIGWHLAVEGWTKIDSVWKGPTETSKPWTSVGYLREASGPFAGVFKDLAGDLDKQALERLKLRPLQPGDDAERMPAINRFPAALSDEWQAWFDRFVKHYGLDEEQQNKAKEQFVRAKDQTAQWLAAGTKEVKRSLGASVATIKQTTPERLAEYEAKLAELDQVLKKELPAFGADVRKQRLTALKGEIGRMRGELVADLSEQTAKMKTALASVLTDEQKKKDALADAEPPSDYRLWTWSRLELVDWLTRWGLLIVGLCLLTGLFTRFACLGGAALLLLFYISMPPLPGLPEVAKSEGTYLFVNKNLIEMIALLALATTSSGRWLGLDGLLYAMFRRRKAEPDEPTSWRVH